MMDHVFVQHHHAGMIDQRPVDRRVIVPVVAELIEDGVEPPPRQHLRQRPCPMDGEPRRDLRLGPDPLVHDQLDLAVSGKVRQQLGAVVRDARLLRRQGAVVGEAHGVKLIKDRR
jgi:hypothetical protein